MNECKHPVECQDDDGECLWCEQVKGLKDQINGLEKGLEGHAVIVHDGSPYIIGNVDYLLIKGGRVIFDKAPEDVYTPQNTIVLGATITSPTGISKGGIVAAKWDNAQSDIMADFQSMAEKAESETGLRFDNVYIPLWLHHQLIEEHGSRYWENWDVSLVIVPPCDCGLCKDARMQTQPEHQKADEPHIADSPAERPS